MAKRTRVVTVHSDSEDSDASFAPPPAKKRCTHRANAVQAKKRRPHNSDTADQDTVAIASSHPTSIHVISDPAPLRESLLAWYAGVHEHRGMPWRRPYNAALDRDQRAQRAYEVWISEIMLQQTQVVTVIPYYNRWMTRFPTIKHLAASDIETVNALWKGLGYYSRAARLLSASKKVVAELDGRLPDNAKEMEAKIPGIGRYSAGAICSIAYNECVPVLDGNVNRLLGRVLAIHANPKAKATLDVLWAGAESMVRTSTRAGDINQALIELGATVCRPRDPDCDSCPLRAWCGAYQHCQHPNGKVWDHATPDIEDLCSICEPLPLPLSVTAFPMKVERKKARQELDIVNVVEWRHQPGSQDRWFLLIKRSDAGLLAGLHEFPTVPNVLETLSAQAMRDLPHRLLSGLLTAPVHPYDRTAERGRSTRAVIDTSQSPPAETVDHLRIVKIESAGDVTHVFSHIKKTYRVQWVVLEGGGGSDPPSFRPFDDNIGGEEEGELQQTKASATTRTNGKLVDGQGDGDELCLEGKGGRQEQRAAAARWLLMKDVPEANIGTGVLKVWKQVSTLWAKDARTGSDVEYGYPHEGT
ncbi:DNA glycosylase [Cytidiella melzeri]|nr:DNA glycosylase [Cytidiella melzeri]